MESRPGPFSHANATIGRSYTLLSINAANCGKSARLT